MSDACLRDRVNSGVRRRDLLLASAALTAGLASSAMTSGANAAATQSNPLVPIPIPAQVPAKEGMAQLPDTKLWYWDTGGNGTPIVLSHPASGSGLVWGYQQPVFAKAGYRVIGYSRRGYFNSAPYDKAKPGIGSEDLQRLVDILGLGRFHLVASAAGGSIASDFAFSHPERLLSLTVSSSSFGVRDGAIDAAANFIRPKIWDEIPVEYREVGPSYRGANPEGFKQWVALNRKALLGPDFRQTLANKITEAKLGELKVPTLLISGTADLTAPPSIVRMVAAKLPNSELIVVDESGHSVYWERPDVFNRAVLEFIGKHGK
jgi:pimeloyl-ACP methyl ester carboxylesterase